MVGQFDGRHALITGGGSGIGAAAARLLAAEGARVAFVRNRPVALDGDLDAALMGLLPDA